MRLSLSGQITFGALQERSSWGLLMLVLGQAYFLWRYFKSISRRRWLIQHLVPETQPVGVSLLLVAASKSLC